jgi:hypothetical protein
MIDYANSVLVLAVFVYLGWKVSAAHEMNDYFVSTLTKLFLTWLEEDTGYEYCAGDEKRIGNLIREAIRKSKRSRMDTAK